MRLYLVAPQLENSTENADTFIVAASPEEAGRLYREGVETDTISCPDAVPPIGKLRVFTIPDIRGRTAGPIGWGGANIPVSYV